MFFNIVGDQDTIVRWSSYTIPGLQRLS